MAWIGTALYAALAVGAPAGVLVYEHFGFRAVAIAAALIPILALPIILRVDAPASETRSSSAVGKVGKAVWLPGVAVALAGFGFAAITTFIVLLFTEHSWTPTWLPFSLMSTAFILGRAGFGHLPDRIGGAKVAIVSILIEAVGQLLIWSAHNSILALSGTVLTGLGFSLVYPALGVEAIRRAPVENRGLAMGAYTSFLDLSIGVAGPILGLVASWTNLGAVFLASALAALLASVTTGLLMTRPLRGE